MADLLKSRRDALLIIYYDIRAPMSAKDLAWLQEWGYIEKDHAGVWRCTGKGRGYAQAEKMRIARKYG
jgi:hypothetical protein